MGGRPADAFGRHVDWAAFAGNGHICVTRPLYTDAFSWITKKKIAWKAQGFYQMKRGEPPLELLEPYNANVVRPLRKLRGDRITDTAGSMRAAVRADGQSRTGTQAARIPDVP